MFLWGFFIGVCTTVLVAFLLLFKITWPFPSLASSKAVDLSLHPQIAQLKLRRYRKTRRVEESLANLLASIHHAGVAGVHLDTSESAVWLNVLSHFLFKTFSTTLGTGDVEEVINQTLAPLSTEFWEELRVSDVNLGSHCPLLHSVRVLHPLPPPLPSKTQHTPSTSSSLLSSLLSPTGIPSHNQQHPGPLSSAPATRSSLPASSTSTARAPNTTANAAATHLLDLSTTELECEVSYHGDAHLCLRAEMLINFPVPKTASLPMEFSLSNVTFSAKIRVRASTKPKRVGKDSDHGKGTKGTAGEVELRLELSDVHFDFDLHSAIGHGVQLQDPPALKELVHAACQRALATTALSPNSLSFKLPLDSFGK